MPILLLIGIPIILKEGLYEDGAFYVIIIMIPVYVYVLWTFLCDDIFESIERNIQPNDTMG